MPHPLVVHVRQAPFDTYIGRSSAEFRGSPWANPFTIRLANSRERSVELYRRYVLSMSSLLSQVKLLENKTLGCWCAPELCHGEVLVELSQWSQTQIDEALAAIKPLVNWRSK